MSEIAMDQAEQALRRLDLLRPGAARRVTHQRSPRGDRVLYVVEDTRVDDLDHSARVDVEQEHRAVHPMGIGEAGDQRDARAVRVAQLPHLTGGRDPRELSQPVRLLPYRCITSQPLRCAAQRRLRAASVSSSNHQLNHLGIQRWLVWGGSWRATLALAYSQRHPGRVSEIVLASVTMTRPAEIQWLYHGVGRFFPAEWARFRAGVLEPDRDGDLVAAYYRLLHDPDPTVGEQPRTG